ncbi:hypothetical protein [uncultured Imperialibacter sp.]|uniref:hypothetical protein n=1 Tax=uncultured Imperialibacter sp. TaxID=1672639 RepID=UPI0030D92690|tara:strand:- start:77975 stop:79990 length:2016 start_codon:yes stop_codon:yes gene_type:complete
MGAAVSGRRQHIAPDKGVWPGIPVYVVAGCVFTPRRRKGMLLVREDTRQNVSIVDAFGVTNQHLGCEDTPKDVRCGDTSRDIGCGDTPKNTKDTPQNPIVDNGVGQNIRYLGWRVATVLLLTLAFPPTLFAQDLETLGDQKLFAYNGSLSATQTFYHAEGMPSRRDPYFWQLNANLNLTFLGIISVPLSATLSQQNKSFAQPQPFNRFGISPTYKGLTVHLGHRTINFSDYTLAGNLFFGAGVEYKPENNPVRVSAMYGRFAKPVANFSQFGQVYAEPTYRRIGFGTKVGFELEKQRAAVMFFRAYDDPNSIDVVDSSFVVTPEENLVVGLEGGFKFFDRFSLEGEYAYSLFTRDRRIPELFTNDYSFINNLGGLYKPNGSSAFTNALKSRLTYQGDGFQANLSYRRVDPGYTTHGSSFLNNDLEDITAGLSLPLFNNRVTLSTSSGLQHNNLDNQNSAQVNRYVFSSSAAISATEKLNINLNVSNYSTSTQQLLLQTDILSDTLEFFQVTRSAMASVNYQTGKETNTGTLFVSGNLQDATDNQGNGSLFKSGNAGYSFKIGEYWSTNTSFTINQSEASGISNLTLGPVFGVNRSFMDNKVRSSLSLSLLNSYLNKSRNSHIDNVRWSVNWTAGKRHTVSFNTFYLLKNTYEEAAKATQEWRGTLNYAFRL